MRHDHYQISEALARRGRGAFGLAELLVTMGFIGLLVGLVLAAVRAARVSADRVRCAANLRELSILIREGSAARGGFGPVLGEISLRSPVNGPDSFTRALNDSQRTRYRYQDFELWAGEIIPVTLDLWLFPGRSIGSTSSLGTDLLRCPADLRGAREGGSDLLITGSAALSIGFNWLPQDYAPNAYIFSYREHRIDGKPHPKGGKIGAAKSAATVVMFADARPGEGVFQLGGEQVGWPATAAELAAASSTRMDLDRHRGRANVAFVDGHVESVAPKTLAACRLVPLTAGE